MERERIIGMVLLKESLCNGYYIKVVGSGMSFDECKMSRRGESIGVYVTYGEVIGGSTWGSVSATR